MVKESRGMNQRKSRNEKTLKCGHGEEYRKSVRRNIREIKK